MYACVCPSMASSQRLCRWHLILAFASVSVPVCLPTCFCLCVCLLLCPSVTVPVSLSVLHPCLSLSIGLSPHLRLRLHLRPWLRALSSVCKSLYVCCFRISRDDNSHCHRRGRYHHPAVSCRRPQPPLLSPLPCGSFLSRPVVRVVARFLPGLAMASHGTT